MRGYIWDEEMDWEGRRGERRGEYRI